MEIQVNEVEYCKMDVACLASTEEVSSKKEEVLKAFRNAPVPGFRKGKAPLEVVTSHYRKQIDESLKRAMAEEAYHNYIFEKQAKPLSQPNFKNVFLNNKNFECQFSIYTKPEFELKEYKNFNIPKDASALSESNFVEDVIQKLRLKHGDSVSYTEDDFVQAKDALVINYYGFLNGEPVPQLTAEGELLQMGNASLKYFEDNLLGMKVGDSREFTVTVQDGNPDFVGKEVTFKVDLLSGSKNQPHPLNDDLAKKVNFESEEKLRVHVHGLYQQYISEHNRNHKINQLSNRLVANHDFKVPDFLSLQEAQYLAHKNRVQWNSLTDEQKKGFVNQAERNVKLSLVLEKVRGEEPEAQLSEPEVLDMVKQRLSMLLRQENVDVHLQKMSQTGELMVMASQMRDEHVLNFLVKTCNEVE